MTRPSFQPNVDFDQNKKSITVSNDSNQLVRVAVSSRGQLGSFVDVVAGSSSTFGRADFEVVAIANSAREVLGAVYTANGSLVRWKGMALDLPLGFVLGTCENQLEVVVANETDERIDVNVSAGLSLRAEWISVAPGTSTTVQTEKREFVAVRYFDGGRAGTLVVPGQTLRVGSHQLPLQQATPQQPHQHNLSFLSFNVRYGTANDRLNSWHYRRGILRDVLASRLPTVFGLQESQLFQRQQIAEAFPWYQFVGVGREHNFGGEGTPLFYDARLFMLKFTETYWLSETPNVPGSVTKSWGNNLPRIATLAHLIPNQSVSGGVAQQLPVVVVVNVHLDHQAPLARHKSAQLVCARTNAYLRDQNLDPNNVLVVIMGDFNNDKFGEPENKTIETDGGLFDALQSHGRQGSFHDFTGITGSVRIDWIYISKTWANRILKTEIIQDKAGGGSSGEWWPSDHLPVLVDLSVSRSLACKTSLRFVEKERVSLPTTTVYPTATFVKRTRSLVVLLLAVIALISFAALAGIDVTVF
ncbi:UNVERIFIED_CONTAM: hypothetical protein HDU68_011838 [Siphonaria sp. JEL0065]|nr:hypothetical protein HDU68_011838 [Siphonaria sp. JEL0065]